VRTPKSILRALLFVVALCPSALFGQAPVSDDAFATVNHHGNYGKLPYLAVQGPDAETYIKFDLSRLPEGTTGDQVKKATVRLFVSGFTHSGSFDVQRVASSWDEETLTGETLPRLGMIDVTGVRVARNSRGHYLIFDITALVKDWVNQAQPNYGIALVPVGDISVAFDSKENTTNSHDPELNIVLVHAGPMGPQGPRGLQGLAGLAGPIGPAGPIGATGLQGPSGPVGPMGPQGLAGKTGATGPAGPIGATGSAGPAGPVGATGAVGPQGPTGPIGATGAIGPQGPAGSVGATGAIGPQGLAGPVGATGATGPQGPTGPIGPIGPQGPAGTQGLTGTPGTPGATGPAGPMGATGAQGPQGPVGPIGPIGPQGPPGPVNYPGTGSLTVSHMISPNPVLNLSAEGTKDWFAPGGSTTGNVHSKLLGGRIMKSFDWVTDGQTLFTQPGSFSISSNTSDDAAGSRLTSSTTDQGLLTYAGATGIGYRLRVPASSTGTRTLKIYSSVFSAAVTLTARFTDGSVADASDLVDAGTGGYNYFVWTISYQSAHDGEELEISAIITTNHGGTPNLKFAAATLQ